MQFDSSTMGFIWIYLYVISIHVDSYEVFVSKRPVFSPQNPPPAKLGFVPFPHSPGGRHRQVKIMFGGHFHWDLNEGTQGLEKK